MARQGSKFGVPAPVLIQMEQDIDNEIEHDKKAQQKSVNQSPKSPVKQKVSCDFKSLDEMVIKLLHLLILFLLRYFFCQIHFGPIWLVFMS